MTGSPGGGRVVTKSSCWVTRRACGVLRQSRKSRHLPGPSSRRKMAGAFFRYRIRSAQGSSPWAPSSLWAPGGEWRKWVPSSASERARPGQPAPPPNGNPGTGSTRSAARCWTGQSPPSSASSRPPGQTRPSVPARPHHAGPWTHKPGPGQPDAEPGQGCPQAASQPRPRRCAPLSRRQHGIRTGPREDEGEVIMRGSWAGRSITAGLDGLRASLDCIRRGCQSRDTDATAS